jgi:hypothetical protein
MLLAMALVLAVSACASGGGSGDGAKKRGSRNHITFEEIDNLDVVDCYQAVQRLRPTWLVTRTGAFPAVFNNGTQQPGGINALRGIPINDVEEIRFLSARDATTRFGTGYLSGAILVKTRNR